MNAPLFIDPTLLDLVADQLAETGYCVLPQLLPLPLNYDLYRRVARLDDHNALTQAGIGRELVFQVNTQIRKDETHWLNDEHPIDTAYLAAMSAFRLAMNERLWACLIMKRIMPTTPRARSTNAMSMPLKASQIES